MTTDQYRAPVIVLGAGLAGLTAARYLKHHGVPVSVFEASKNLAGLCRSEIGDDGFTYDCGAHFINSRLAAALSISDDCLPMPTYEEAFWCDNRRYTYPFGLVTSPKFVASALWAKLRFSASSKPNNITEYFRQSQGAKLADCVSLPLIEAWSGVSGNLLSCSVADKLSTGLLKTIWLRFASWASNRTVAIGYSHEVSESSHVYFVYPEGGIGAVCERMAADLQDIIHTESPVSAIHIENDNVVGVRVHGEDINASAVVNTAPLPILAKLIKGTDRLNDLSAFKYRPMVFVNLKFNQAKIMRDVVTWTPEDQFPFFRVSDIGRALPWLVPGGKNQLTCDIGCEIGDDIWNASDEALSEKCLKGLEKILPGISKEYIGSHVVKTPIAYPVFLLENEESRRQFELGTGIGGLISVGRSGEFKHILMEDVYWRTRKKCSQLIEYLHSGKRQESRNPVLLEP